MLQSSLLWSVVPTQENLVRAGLDLLRLVTIVYTTLTTLEGVYPGLEDLALLSEVIIHVLQLMGLTCLSASLVLQVVMSPQRPPI